MLFLDLLGTAGPRGDDEALGHLEQTRTAVVWSQENLGTREEDGGLDRATWFSDSLNLFYAAAEEESPLDAVSKLVDKVALLQLAFSIESLIARGGIAFGRFFADEHFRYGPALDRAVLLEGSRAKYPRVVLDEAAFAIATGDNELVMPLLRDDDGAVFVDYFRSLGNDDVDLLATFLDGHGGLIEDGLRRYDGIAGIEEKYRWLAGYHNHCVQRDAELLRDDPQELMVACSRPLGTFRAP